MKNHIPKYLKSLGERLERSPIGRRIASGVFWSLLGQGSGKVFTLLAMILTARILGKEAYGEFGLVRSTALTFVTLSGLGMGLTATKHIAESLGSNKDKVGRIIGLSYIVAFIMSSIIAGIFFLAAPWLCETQLKVPHLINAMRLGAGLLFLTTLMSVQTGIMTGFQDFRRLAFTAILSSFLSIPIYVVGAILGGSYGAVCGLIVVTTLNFAINSFFIRANKRKWGVKYLFGELCNEFPVLLNFSLPTLLTAFLVGVTYWLACPFMLISQENGSSELGILTAAFVVHSMIVYIPTQLSGVVLPLLCESVGSDNRSRFLKLSFVQLLLNVGITLAFVVLVVVFARPMMGVFGPAFAEGADVLRILSISCVLMSVCWVTGGYLISRNKKWLDFFCCAVWAAILAIMSYYYHRVNGGAYGVAVAMLVAYGVHAVVSVGLMLFDGMCYFRDGEAGDKEALGT